jgi:hypothetical protein
MLKIVLVQLPTLTRGCLGQVLRQDAFVSRAYALGWTSQDFLSSDSSVVIDSIEAYHKFLDIAARNPRQNLVPTIHIDLSWHAHQLSGENYRLETTKFVGRFLNHADKVEEGLLG